MGGGGIAGGQNVGLLLGSRWEVCIAGCRAWGCVLLPVLLLGAVRYCLCYCLRLCTDLGSHGGVQLCDQAWLC